MGNLRCPPPHPPQHVNQGAARGGRVFDGVCFIIGNFPSWWTTLEGTNQSGRSRTPDLFVEGNALEILHSSVWELPLGPAQTLNTNTPSSEWTTRNHFKGNKESTLMSWVPFVPWWKRTPPPQLTLIATLSLLSRGVFESHSRNVAAFGEHVLLVLGVC